jgi:hypothetical protein
MNRVNVVQERTHSEEDLASRRTDPEVPQQLSTFSRVHGALLSALKNNRQIEELYLFDTLR